MWKFFTNVGSEKRTAIPTTTTYRKTTSKAVNGTTATTDLLNGEVTIGANVMGASGVVRLTVWGEWLQNVGSPQNPPRFKVKLGAGATTVLDTNSPGAAVISSTGRPGWRFVIEIMNLGATNSQLVNMFGAVGSNGNGTSATSAYFSGGDGVYANPGGNNAAFMPIEGKNTSAIDTTVAMALQLTVDNQSASGSYETKLLGALVEVI